ncbi:serine hydrolase domain-containing protein [Trinickia acidisoli]|uniref:serine hydrolase domain-containing protein n=1 Tax=Trinickia acidisoli TaxID=2767482 RepID=UPI001F5E089C|nr:serine hydrolase domain-containing protein [Trinickia acidisoli]
MGRLGLLSPLTWLPNVASADVDNDTALRARLDLVMDQAIAEQQIVGAVAFVARGGRLIYQRAVGFADREAGIPVREDTQFRLASMTKLIVSVAALALVEAGRLSLDDPVTRWLPYFRPKLADGVSPAITVRELMTHTSGLNYGFLESANGPYHRLHISDGLDSSGISLDANLRRLAQAPLLSAPGTHWQYSLSMDVLGAIIAKAGGANLPEVVDRTVTGPLKMRDTAFVVDDASRVATPYADGNPPIRMTKRYALPFGNSAIVYSPERAFDKHAFPSGGAGMTGTASDYLVLLEAIRNGGDPVLRRETARALTSNAIGDLAVPLAGPGVGWGLGVAVLRDPNAAHSPSNAGTWQWGGVYGTHFWVDPLAKLSVVVLTNTAVAGTVGDFPDSVRKAVYGVQ